ncbi:MAG TPA: MFS transporter [Candidatus Dormibacteraeota bacterium]|nr:MFS transporter [Candidatus Dormibacteraeota bacterium]
MAEESSLDGEEATSAEAQAHEDAVAAAEATGVETRGFRDLLSNHEFRLIWGSQIASQLADKFLVYSLLTVTYDRSGANTQEAIVLLAYTFPSVLLSPIAGIYADRFDKRRLMMVTNLIRGALILLVPGLALVPYFQTVTWHLLIITLLFSAVGQFFAPAEASSLPFIVPKRLLITATSVFTLTIVATLVVGLPVSSLLVRIHPYVPYFAATGLFLLAAGANFLMKTRLSAKPTAEARVDISRFRRIYDEVAETVEFLRARPKLLTSFWELGLAVMLIFTIFTLAQGYLKTVLFLDPRDSYLILVPAALGMGVVAVYLGSARSIRREILIPGGLVTLGILLMLMGTVPYLLVGLHAHALTIVFAAAVGALFGAAFGAIFIPAVSLLQESTDPEQRGRTFGAMFTVLNLAIAVPLFLAGLAADTFGLHLVVSMMGAIVVFLAIVPVLLRLRRERQAEPLQS